MNCFHPPTDTHLPASAGSSLVRADYRPTPSQFWPEERKTIALGCPRMSSPV